MTPGIFASKVYTKEELCVLDAVPLPCAIVIFGASGDLTHRKLFPSLFYLSAHKLMPSHFYVIGVARTDMTDAAFREKIRAVLPTDAPKDEIQKFIDKCHYISGEYGSVATFQKLKGSLADLDKKFGVAGHRIFYLSTPPSVYHDIVKNLGSAGLSSQGEDPKEWVRVVIEKPFGHSQVSARELNKEIRNHLREWQIYRIDHYLGKETVQNILMFRFANIMFEPIWNRNYIDNIQITASEELGVEHRAGYYEQAGILRDMFQNHLLQLFALTAMEPPASLDANSVRDRRLSVLKSIRCPSLQEVKDNSICAQYGAGLIDGKKVAGYRQEKGVNSNSRIATYAAMRLELENWRWEGVPFFFRAGKRLATREVEIAVQFKRIPTSIFKPLLADQLSANVLKFRIQPDEGITMQFEAKHPGPKLCMSSVSMDFGYQDTFKTPPPESYARLFQDAMVGDQTLFARSDEVDESWRIIDPISNYWESEESGPIITYPSGSMGPKEADELMGRSGRSWI